MAHGEVTLPTAMAAPLLFIFGTSSMNTAAFSDDKAALRSDMLRKRKDLRVSNINALDDLAKQVIKALSGLQDATVSGYVAIGDELDVSASLAALQEIGASIVLPVAGKSGEVLSFRPWCSGDELEKGRLSTYHPSAKTEAPDPDVLLVPLVAFDTQGYRLGFGGGYYDRTLSALREKKNIAAYGIGYDGQEVESIPREVHDAQLDGIITPTRIILSKP